MQRKQIFKIIFLIVTFSLYSCISLNINQESIIPGNRYKTKNIGVDSLDLTNHNLKTFHFFSTDSIYLKGYWLSTKTSKKYLLYFGGNYFKVTPHILKIFDNLKINLILFNYRGYGNNPGIPSIDGIVKDGLGIYNYVNKKLSISSDNIVLMGHSIGTFVVLNIASYKNCSSIILDSPFSNFTDLSNEYKKEFPFYWRIIYKINYDKKLFKLNNIKLISNIKYPTLVIARELDELTPPMMVKKVYESSIANDKKYVVLKGSTHNKIKYYGKYYELINKYINL